MSGECGWWLQSVSGVSVEVVGWVSGAAGRWECYDCQNPTRILMLLLMLLLLNDTSAHLMAY